MHVLITAGPTREYIDDVRYLTNGSSGRMGYALAEAARQRGWTVTLVSGPVAIKPPQNVDLVRVTSACEMLDACLRVLDRVDGVLAVAAVADYRPATRHSGKIHRTAEPLHLDLVPNPDIIAELCRMRTRQWAVAFAVESTDALARARTKLATKGCDAIVVNSSQAIESAETRIQLLDKTGSIAFQFEGAKADAAQRIIDWIADHLARGK